MYVVKLSIENDKVIIRGDIVQLEKSRSFVNWLEENYKSQIEKDYIVLNSLELLDTSKLFKFKDSKTLINFSFKVYPAWSAPIATRISSPNFFV